MTDHFFQYTYISKSVIHFVIKKKFAIKFSTQVNTLDEKKNLILANY